MKKKVGCVRGMYSDIVHDSSSTSFFYAGKKCAECQKLDYLDKMTGNWTSRNWIILWGRMQGMVDYIL